MFHSEAARKRKTKKAASDTQKTSACSSTDMSRGTSFVLLKEELDILSYGKGNGQPCSFGAFSVHNKQNDKKKKKKKNYAMNMKFCNVAKLVYKPQETTSTVPLHYPLWSLATLLCKLQNVQYNVL